MKQRASSINRTDRSDKTSPSFSSRKNKNNSRKIDIRQLNTEEFLDLLPRKTSQSIIRTSSTNTPFNLPEFIHFQSDHLVLLPQITSYSFYDRLHNLSTLTTKKFNRQSIDNISNDKTINSKPTSIISGGLPSTKRLSRSRQIHHIPNSHDQTQAHTLRSTSLRQTTSKFDSMAYCHEVSRLVFWFFLFFYRTHSLERAAVTT